MREVSVAGAGDVIRKADDGFMSPGALGSVPGEGVSARLVIPHLPCVAGQKGIVVPGRLS